MSADRCTFTVHSVAMFKSSINKMIQITIPVVIVVVIIIIPALHGGGANV